MQRSSYAPHSRSKAEAHRLLDNPETIRSFLRHIPSKHSAATAVNGAEANPTPKAETVAAEPTVSYPISPISPEKKPSGGQLRVADTPIYVCCDSLKSAVQQKETTAEQSKEPQSE
jgi:hypothetical protein